MCVSCLSVCPSVYLCDGAKRRQPAKSDSKCIMELRQLQLQLMISGIWPRPHAPRMQLQLVKLCSALWHCNMLQPVAASPASAAVFRLLLLLLLSLCLPFDLQLLPVRADYVASSLGSQSCLCHRCCCSSSAILVST